MASGGGVSGRHARAPEITVPPETCVALAASDTPAATNIVCPNDASDRKGATSPLEEPAPVFESMASAP